LFCLFFFFFFFQAEDGIRDVAVTGVQTCALPIYTNSRSAHTMGFVVAMRPAVRLPCASSTAVFGSRSRSYVLRPSSMLVLRSREIGRAHVELQSRLHLVCRLLLEKKKK